MSYLGISRDITQHKRNQAALLKSERFLQSTLDALSAYIAILDERGSIIAANAARNNFARQNVLLGGDYSIGTNCISLCESAAGECAVKGPLSPWVSDM